MKKHSNNIQEGTIDYKQLGMRFASRWYVFVISLAISYGLCELYLRYQENVYQVNSKLLIKDDGKNMRGLGGLDMFGDQKNLHNEIGIIRSFDMMYRVMSELDFDISYYHEGKILTNELYKDAPFRVVPDSGSPQIIQVPFYITILSANTFVLEAEAPNGASLHNLETQQSEGRLEPFTLKKKCTFGEPVSLENTSFTVYLKNPYYQQGDGKNYFYINDRNRLAHQYKNRLQVGPASKESSIINLAVSGPALKKEIDFVNKVAEVYLQSGYDEKVQIASSTISFIDDQITQVSAALKNAEGEMEDFRASHRVMNLGATAEEAYAKLERFENEKSNVLLELKYYDYIQDYVRSNKDMREVVVPSAIGIADPVLNKLIGELIQYKAERTQLEETSTEKNPYLRALDRKIDYTMKSLEESIKNVINGTRVTLKDLNTRITSIERTVNSLPKTERMLLDIQRRFNLNDHLYNFLLERKAEAGITKASTQIDHKILEKASLLNSFKIAPKEDSIKIAFFSLAFLLPIIGIFLRDFLNDKIQSREDIENNTEIPVLGTVGHSRKDSQLVVHEQPKSAIAEAFRSIRVNMQYLGKGQKVIAITSTISGEGKTFTSMNLASVFAISGKKTVLIGGDLRKPRIHQDFKLSNDIGLSTFLAGKAALEEIIHPTGVDCLDIICSGPVPPNPGDLLQVPRMEGLIEALKKSYDHIIIDTPPVGLVADALLLMRYSDVNLYIVRHKYTAKKMLEKVDTLHAEGKLDNVSIIINDLCERDARYGYGYSYGYYTNYGYDASEEKKKLRLKKLFRRNKTQV
ncbi:polysaccharide biosynthesis tyrosine autokinase [Cytophagaceae bacterium ABcell3]|nr:polysaccharide biosynthesis tyrosine autokinase [Cytophagaceae bacterium ABcell3]